MYTFNCIATMPSFVSRLVFRTDATLCHLMKWYIFVLLQIWGAGDFWCLFSYTTCLTDLKVLPKGDFNTCLFFNGFVRPDWCTPDLLILNSQKGLIVILCSPGVLQESCAAYFIMGTCLGLHIEWLGTVSQSNITLTSPRVFPCPK